MTSPQNDSIKPKKKMKTYKKVLVIILCVILAIVLAISGVFAALYFMGKNAAKPDEPPVIVPPEDVTDIDTDDDGRTVYYGGEKYKYNDNITTCLVMGTDNSDREGAEIGSSGEADALFLVVFDTSSGKVSVINISRDTMAEVTVYTTDGIPVRKDLLQICMAYDYGDGRELSCKNVAEAVSSLMCGVPVVKYISVDIAAIPALTDAIGGVDVPEYDNATSQKTGNTVTLYGEAAREYVQRRNKEELASNNTRMQKQMDYIRAFAGKAIAEAKGDITVPASLFGVISDYMITDVDASLVTYYATNYITKSGTIEYLSLPGTVTEGDDGYAEFNVDYTKMYEMILSVFYIKE